MVALRQLVERGLSRSAVRSRVATGRLHRVHAGVFAVGHPTLTRNGRYMAAVLACGGPGAVLSHRSAAALHGPRASSRAIVDVTSPRRTGRGRSGIDVHSGSTLLPRDAFAVDGVPCTSVARTLLDLAEAVRRREVERACDRAAVLEIYDQREVDDVLARRPGGVGR